MATCGGCSQAQCFCPLVAGDCIVVDGTGTLLDPYEINVEIAPDPNAVECTLNGLSVLPSSDSGNGLGIGTDGRLIGPGTLGYASRVTNQLGIGTVDTDLTGLSVSVTVGTGRRIRITGYGIFQQRTSAGLMFLFIKEGFTQLNQAIFSVATDEFATLMTQVILLPSAGPHTYKLQAKTSVNTMELNASAIFPAFILVEDIGV